VFLLVLDLLVAGILLMKLMKTKVSRERGTNTFTRFVRDGVGQAKTNQVIMIGGGTSLIVLLIGAFTKSWYACIPTIGVVVFAFVQQFQSNRSKQRVKDARVVTKTTGKVAAATGTAAVAVGATVATGGIASGGMAAVATIGATAAAAGATRVIDKSMDQMTDVEGPNISKDDFKELNAFASKFANIDIEHPEEFIEAARRAGIETNGKDLSEVAENVIKFAPPAALAALPDNITDEEKAMRIMKGAI